MKIQEVRRPSARCLMETFDSSNRSGFLTEDLVSIAQAHQADQWSAPQTYEQYMAEDEQEYQAWLSSQQSKK